MLYLVKQYFDIQSTNRRHWPVVVAARIRPRLKLLRRRGLRKKRLAPPVTEMMSLGEGIFQYWLSKSHSNSGLVSLLTRMYCRKKQDNYSNTVMVFFNNLDTMNSDLVYHSNMVTKVLLNAGSCYWKLWYSLILLIKVHNQNPRHYQRNYFYIHCLVTILI